MANFLGSRQVQLPHQRICLIFINDFGCGALRVPPIPRGVLLVQRSRVRVRMKQQREQVISMKRSIGRRQRHRAAMARQGIIVARLPFVDARQIAVRDRPAGPDS